MFRHIKLTSFHEIVSFVMLTRTLFAFRQLTTLQQVLVRLAHLSFLPVDDARTGLISDIFDKLNYYDGRLCSVRYSSICICCISLNLFNLRLSSLATSIYPSEQPSNASGFQEKLLPPEVQGPRVPMGAGGSRYMTLSQRKKLHGKSKASNYFDKKASNIKSYVLQTFGALNPLHVATNIKEDPVEEDEDVSQETDEEDESPTKTSAQSTAVPKKRKRAPRTSRVSMGKSRMIVDDEDSRSTTSTRRKELASARLRKSALLTAKTKTLSTNAANARRVKVILR